MQCSIWFKVGRGPFLEATAKIRDAFKRCCDDERLNGGWRLGDDRWSNGVREAEVIYSGGEPNVKEIICSSIYLGI